MNDKQVFAQNLKGLRVKVGVSQRALAKNLDIQPTAVSAYERSEKLPTVENLIKIADWFGISTDDLLGQERKPAKIDMLTVAKSLLDDYGFNWDTKSKCFYSTDGNVAALIAEYKQIRDLVKDGYIKADVLELWMKDKRKNMGGEK